MGNVIVSIDGEVAATLKCGDSQSNELPCPIVNALDYGVVGDGVTDDTQATVDTLNYVSENGGVAVFPENVLLNGLVEITETSEPFSIEGGSFLVCNTDGGIKINVSNIRDQVKVTSNFVACTDKAGRPLEIICPLPTPVSWRTQSVILEDIECRLKEFNNSAYSFDKGIRVENAWHGRATNVVFNGAENGNTTACNEALIVAGRSINFDCVSCYASNVTEGFIASDECEGFKALFTNVVVAKRGFVAEGTSPNPQLILLGCHTNVTERAVKAVNWNQVFISKCDFYRFGTVAGYKDVELIGCSDFTIQNNSAQLGGANQNWFVKSTNCSNGTVSDNHLAGRWHHVEIDGTSNNVTAYNNKQRISVANSEADELINNAAGSNNKLQHWKLFLGADISLTAAVVTNTALAGTWKVIDWNAAPVINDIAGYISANNDRITVADFVNTVELSANLRFNSNPNGYREIEILKNGVDVVAEATTRAVNGTTTTLVIAPIRLNVNAGDYFQLRAKQNSGATVGISATLTRLNYKALS